MVQIEVRLEFNNPRDVRGSRDGYNPHIRLGLWGRELAPESVSLSISEEDARKLWSELGAKLQRGRSPTGSHTKEDRMSSYPAWICAGCGNKHGKTYKGQLSTFHEPDPSDPTDRCGWCGSTTAILTEPRDYGYPLTTKTHSEEGEG